jgi:hypothetical protein
MREVMISRSGSEILLEHIRDALWEQDDVAKMFKALSNAVDDLNQHCSPEQGVEMVYEGVGDLVRIGNVGFRRPNLVTLAGRDSRDRPTIVVLHSSQVRVVLRIVDRSEGNGPTKIGFDMPPPAK